MKGGPTPQYSVRRQFLWPFNGPYANSIALYASCCWDSVTLVSIATTASCLLATPKQLELTSR